jgi:hypothetical protein
MGSRGQRGKACRPFTTSESTRGRKYRIRGTTRFSEAIEQVVKLGPNGKLVVITVYRP